jgi:hypothetical protein
MGMMRVVSSAESVAVQVTYLVWLTLEWISAAECQPTVDYGEVLKGIMGDCAQCASASLRFRQLGSQPWGFNRNCICNTIALPLG